MASTYIEDKYLNKKKARQALMPDTKRTVIQPNANRGTAIQEPEPAMLQSQTPMGTGEIRNESTGESVSMNPDGTITNHSLMGPPIAKLSSRIGRNPTPALQGPTQPVTQSNGLVVEFDNSVTPQARQAFNALPARDAETQASWAKHDRQWLARQPERSTYQSSSTQRMPKLLQKGNGMGWKQRTALNKQILANSQSGANNARDNATTRATTASGTSKAGLANAQAANLNAQAQERTTDDELNQINLEYMDQNTTPERKGAIEAYYKLLGKGTSKAGLTVSQPQVKSVFNKELNMYEDVVVPASIINKDTGTSRQVVPENDDPYEYRTNADGTKSRRLKNRS